MDYCNSYGGLYIICIAFVTSCPKTFMFESKKCGLMGLCKALGFIMFINLSLQRRVHIMKGKHIWKYFQLKNASTFIASNRINGMNPRLDISGHISLYNAHGKYINQSKRSDVARVSRRLKSLATRLFVEKLAQAIDNKNVKAPHYCPFARGIHR